MQYFSRRSFAITVALCTTLLVQAVAASGPCSSGIPNNTGTYEWTPTIDFTINSDGTATHVKTGLMWKRCVEGGTGVNCQTGGSFRLTWAEALKAAVAANSARFANYTDWRLPNKKELESIVDLCGVSYTTLNPVVFPIGLGDVWTSTTFVRDPTIAFSVNFEYGTTRISRLKTEKLEVLLVRGGRTVDAADLLQQ